MFLLFSLHFLVYPFLKCICFCNFLKKPMMNCHFLLCSAMPNFITRSLSRIMSWGHYWETALHTEYFPLGCFYFLWWLLSRTKGCRVSLPRGVYLQFHVYFETDCWGYRIGPFMDFLYGHRGKL